jgi:uncharacterized membrane protein
MIIILLRWIINIIEKYLGPVVHLITDTDSKLYIIGIYILSILAIFLIFFFIGLIIKTQWGQFLNHQLEKNYLLKIPGYKIIKDTVNQFFGKNKSFFKEVVIVDLFNSKTLMTGFITDDQGDFLTVFVPTGPNPTSGNIYHVPKENVFRTKSTVDVGMKSIISCGAGSTEILGSIVK